MMKIVLLKIKDLSHNDNILEIMTTWRWIILLGEVKSTNLEQPVIENAGKLASVLLWSPSYNVFQCSFAVVSFCKALLAQQSGKPVVPSLCLYFFKLLIWSSEQLIQFQPNLEQSLFVYRRSRFNEIKDYTFSKTILPIQNQVGTQFYWLNGSWLCSNESPTSFHSKIVKIH